MRRLPLQQFAAGKTQSAQRANDGIETDDGIIRQKRNGEDDLQDLADALAADISQTQVQWQIIRRPKQLQHERKRSGQSDDGEDEQAPDIQVVGKHGPAHQQQENERGGHEAAAEVVKNFPA